MKKYGIVIGVAVLLLLGGCEGQNAQKNNTAATAKAASGQPENVQTSENTGTMHDSGMMHEDGGKLPEGLKAETNPAYKIGSKVILTADHMEGMKGAEATIAGAYDTTAYAVTYTPTTGGEPVKNHKWVIQEEIKDAGGTTLEPGAKVTLEADHMKGMKGAAATIESANPATVYMVDYKPTNGGPEVKNHKWVVESEITAK